MPTEIEATDVLMGAMLRKAREKKGLSVMKLYKMSGVGRRTIDDGEKGRNIGTFILRKLMRTLGMTEITIGGDMTVRYAPSGIAPGVVMQAVRQIEQGATVVLDAVETLKAFGADSAQAASRDAGMSARAAALARKLADHLENASPKELADLERSLTDKEVGASTTTKRRKKTA
jgi:transcriptional regulator with XRE-family HTH domain